MMSRFSNVRPPNCLTHALGLIFNAVHGQEAQAEIEYNKAVISHAKGGKEDFIKSEQAVAAEAAREAKVHAAKAKQQAMQAAKKKPSGSGSSGTV
jgi:hypothetical protein